MPRSFRALLGLICFFSLVSVSCVWQQTSPGEIFPESVRLIAVMPVKNSGGQRLEERVARAHFLEGMYFRGYPKIPPSLIDEAIASLRGKTAALDSGVDYGTDIQPQKLGEMLGVDAIMYIDIKTAKRQVESWSGSYTLTVDLTLVGARSGGTIWKRNYDKNGAIWGVNRFRMDVESVQEYEKKLMEILDDAVGGLPFKKRSAVNAATS